MPSRQLTQKRVINVRPLPALVLLGYGGLGVAKSHDLPFGPAGASREARWCFTACVRDWETQLE